MSPASASGRSTNTARPSRPTTTPSAPSKKAANICRKPTSVPRKSRSNSTDHPTDVSKNEFLRGTSCPSWLTDFSLRVRQVVSGVIIPYLGLADLMHRRTSFPMKRLTHAVRIALALLLTATTAAQQKFPVVSIVDEPTIAGRPVALDAQGKLLPWPMPDNIGYSYSSHILSQWTILWDQYNRQRLPYFHCCFDIDRTTYELLPDQKWAKSNG